MNIVEDYLQNWTTEDGGGCLDLQDKAAPFNGCTLQRTNNENPILFLTQMGVEVCPSYPEYMSRFRDRYLQHMQSTEIEPGLHSRRCGDTFYIGQSHDNIVGMVIGSFVFGAPDYAEKVYQYGSKNRWCFNVQKPGEYDIRHQIQGGDIAICALASGRKPEPWNLVWLAGGIAVSQAFNLADLRMQFIQNYVWEQFSAAEKLLLSVAMIIHKWRRGPASKHGGTRFGYFSAEHPFSRFQLNGGKP